MYWYYITLSQFDPSCCVNINDYCKAIKEYTQIGSSVALGELICIMIGMHHSLRSIVHFTKMKNNMIEIYISCAYSKKNEVY